MSTGPAYVDLTEHGGVFKPSPSPTFVMYSDAAIIHADQVNTMSQELINRLVRNTVSNIRSACQILQHPRDATIFEVEEMAMMLCKKYPCLARVSNDG